MDPDPLAVLLDPVPDVTGRRTPVPDAVRALAARQYGLASRRQCEERGLSTSQISRLVRRGLWPVVARGVVLVDPRAVGRTDWTERARQRAQVAALAGGPDAVLVGLAALSWLDVQGAPLRYVPEYARHGGGAQRVQPAVRQRRLIMREEIAGHPKTVVRDGVTVAGPLWALQQALPEVGREHGVSLLDSALHTGRLLPPDLALLAHLLTSMPGVRAIRSWLPLADGRAESPAETRARLVCHDDGVPPDDLQRVILDERGEFVARCDLVWDLGGGRLLVIEMDGEHHRRTGQILRDNARDSDLAGLGHVVHHLSWEDLFNGRLVRIVRRELRQAGRLA